MNSLKKLYQLHQGKVSDKWELYLGEYDRLFSPYRDQPVHLLEIGIQNGGSLEIWSQYFEKGQRFVGCDINPDCAMLEYQDPRISVIVGDANTNASELEIVQASEYFNLIIDDGSHTSSDIVKSFARYFPRLSDGGLYVAEDLHCSYWQGFEGGLYYPYSSISFFKRLADVVNYEHWGVKKNRSQLLNGIAEHFSVEFPEGIFEEIHSVEFVNSMCVIRKSASDSNLLGARVIAGQQELVIRGHHQLRGALSPIVDESVNPWSIFDKAPDELFELLSISLKDSKTILAKRDAQLAERDAQLAELGSQISQKDILINRQKKEIEEIDLSLSVIQKSSSWRITRPLRWIGTQIYRGKLLVKASKLAVTHTGGITEAIFRAVRVINAEGISGVRNRARFLLVGGYSSRSLQPGTNESGELRFVRPTEVKRHTQSVDIIVCVHNALDDVRRCLKSILAHTLPPYRLIIVDDGSKEETRQFLDVFVTGQPITLLRNPIALGYTKAANCGLKASTGDFVILLNSDTIVPELWLDRLIECANSSERVGMAGPLSNTASWQSVPRVMNEEGDDWADNPLPNNWTIDEFANEIARISPRIYPRVGFLNGFCLLIKRELINEIGLFDEDAFARGYGEENDYCIRATENNWQLAIADDCYVYHAQSKSYSHERRAELARLAGEILANKHEHWRIERNLSWTHSHPALVYMRERSGDIENLAQLRLDVQERFEGKRVLYLLPSGGAGGGSNVVLTEAVALREIGVDAWIANLEANKLGYLRDFSDFPVPVTFLRDPSKLKAIAEDFDAVIATLFTTVDWLEPLRNLPNPPVLGYYIQDFEPYFFQDGTQQFVQAFESYTKFPELKLFAKTKWNANEVMIRCGVLPKVIGCSFDVKRFFPSMESHNKSQCIKIVAMVRPSTMRRAPLMTMRVLESIKHRHGDKVKIIIFGASSIDGFFQQHRFSFDYVNAGEIDSATVACLLADVDIFLDCSKFQAMGLTAMEAMASGVAVVGPIHGGLSELITNDKNGLLVDTEDAGQIELAIDSLVSQKDKLNQISLAGLGVVHHNPLIAASNMLNIIFSRAD